MISFANCSNIIMNSQDVYMAVKAFIETNHYYHRPNTNSDFFHNA